VATSGTAVADCCSGFSTVPFHFAGKGFSASGVLSDFGNQESPFTVSWLEQGSTYGAGISGATDNFLIQFALTVNGVPWGIPTGGSASVEFDAFLPVDESFEVTQPFTFEGSFTGAPEPFAAGLSCDVLNCETLNFRGEGIVTFDLSPSFEHPEAWNLETETFNIRGVPEPPTASLLLLGFAGLAVLGWRRNVRAL
jgi:hypothetical protein